MRSVLGLTTTISNVNLPNRGQISWLPEGSIVETNAVFSNDRVVPVTTKPLPVAVQSLVRRCSDNIDILYEGIKKRDKKIIFESFVNQPLCSSLTLDEARSLFDEMYEKNLRFFQKIIDNIRQVIYYILVCRSVRMQAECFYDILPKTGEYLI